MGAPERASATTGFHVESGCEGQRPNSQGEQQVVVSGIQVRDDKGQGSEDGKERREMNEREGEMETTVLEQQ